jgi:hypothetical protein
MGISKIYVNNNLKIDLTKTTATEKDVVAGKEFYNKQGDLVLGTLDEYTPTTTPAIFEGSTDLFMELFSGNENG